MSNNQKNELELTSIMGDLSFSKTDVWVWVRLPPTQYEFLDDSSRERIAHELDSALGNLVTSDEKNVEAHMLVSSKPFDSYAWVVSLNEQSKKHGPNSENAQYLTTMYNHVHYKDFREKLVLLGIKIGKRITYAPGRTLTPNAFDKLVNLVAAAPVQDYVSEKELEYWSQIAKQASLALQNSRIHAIPATTAEIAYLVRKSFFPAMPSPTVEDLSIGSDNKWGEGEIASLVDAQIDNYPKYLKITQEVEGRSLEGFRATLCFSKFPEVLHFPQQEPWIQYASLLPFPVDFSLRFTLEPSRKVRKEVDRKLKEAVDQGQNMTSAGGGASREVEEQIFLGNELDYALKKDTTPWVFGRYRATVEAATLDDLKEQVQQLIDHYRSMDIFVTWPTGDQLSLLKEGIPNDKVRVLAYHQRQELSIISAGMPSGAGSTGDKIKHRPDGTRGWIGPYLGSTTGRLQEPVFFSIHSAINTENSPGCTITGSPGSGKTFAALTITYQMVLEGVWTIYIDPKGDALRLKTLPGLEKSVIIDLQRGNDGLLDPFSITADPSMQKDMANETIALLVGGANSLSDEQTVALAKAIEVVAGFPDASLDRIVDYLKTAPEHGAQSLGARLNLIRQLPFARLCFSKNKGYTLRPEDGLTVISIMGLDLPSSEQPVETYSGPNHLAVAVMYLLTSFTKQLMTSAHKSQPKAIVIDEAWAVTSTPQGSKLVSEVARMGRSHNTALLLISQNAGDFLGESVTNSVSTKIVFKATQKEEIDDVLNYLDIEPSDLNREYVRSLSTGECLLKDWSGRIARVSIDSWNSDQAEAFETNPNARKA